VNGRNLNFQGRAAAKSFGDNRRHHRDTSDTQRHTATFGDNPIVTPCRSCRCSVLPLYIHYVAFVAEQRQERQGVTIGDNARQERHHSDRRRQKDIDAARPRFRSDDSIIHHQISAEAEDLVLLCLACGALWRQAFIFLTPDSCSSYHVGTPFPDLP